MKLNSLSVLCLSLLLLHTQLSLAKRGGGSGKSSGSRTTSTSNRGSSSNTNSNQNNQGSRSQGTQPRQPAQPNQGGYPPQSGRPGYPSYPQQPRGGYPARGSPYGGGYGGGGYGSYGGHGAYGSYGGGHINYNPNNKVLSPRYGSSFGYGGYGARGGSPFSNRVQSMGMYPSDRSRGFGRTALMAATGGVVVGMAVGYGLGRFPRPPYQFHNRQEEQHYNHYMNRKYGTKSTDTNDYSRDYVYTEPAVTYDRYMDSCMKRTDLLSAGNPKPYKKPVATNTTTDVTNTTDTNSTAADNSSTSASSTPRPLNPPVTNPVPPSYDSSAEDDDTISIVEIGYPALIEQMKARKCLEKYMDDFEKYLKRVNGGAQGLEMGSRGLLAVVTSTILMLLNSNMLMLLH